jgi:hypothetical protein
MTPTAWDFQNRLMAILNTARQSGKSYVDVKSSNLHQQVGGQANPDQRMSVCCDVMRRMMRSGDSVLNDPPSGQGPTLMIRYVVQQRNSSTLELTRANSAGDSGS